jgi:predicted amidohydrolase YtcJ
MLSFLFSCKQKTSADLIITNGHVYTADSLFTEAEAVAIGGGKILATGSTHFITSNYNAKETLDAKQQFVYPGFIDAHCHFLQYGEVLNECDLTGTESWHDILQRLQAFAGTHKEGWLVGRGWDQNDWANKQFPVNDSLNILFPERPVLLTRVDGHAVIVNDTLLKTANINSNLHVAGGDIIFKGNKPTGVLIDNAMGLVKKYIPARMASQVSKYLLAAQNSCFAAGLTGVHDCGIDVSDVLVIDSLNKTKQLLMRINALLSDKKANYEWAFSHGKIKTALLNVGSFKLYADGALGSRGACLLQPYSDQPGHYGFLLRQLPYYDSILSVIAAQGWQACTHAIGDSANRVILTAYKKQIGGNKNLRWRIEHAQVINPSDFDLFGESGVVPSVQPTHATSDMYWAKDRLGPVRVKGAYAFKQLLEENGWLPLGTDFPVEDISPIKTFYAAVGRKDAKGFPPGGFQPENALTRQQALRGITIWAAKAAFEENDKGSIEKGKYADLVILDHDLVKTPEDSILSTKVLVTISGGKQVYRGKF